jgi:hypothetical protein
MAASFINADMECRISTTEFDLTSSIFHVASISKEFTAMAIHLLARQGKLSLDDDVRKYIPEVPDFGERITIKHLIHHTSGLRDQWSLLEMAGWREDDVITEGDILDLVSRQKALNFKPGEEHLYSNTGYTLLAIIVKRVSGQSLREFADANIFKPLGMTRTHFHDDHTMIVKDRTSAYQPRPGGSLKVSIPVFDTYGATSLFTTVEDMAKWDQNFVDKKVGGEQVIEHMLTVGVLNNGRNSVCIRLSVGKYKGLNTVGHGGADAGYRADFRAISGSAVFCGVPLQRQVTPTRQCSRVGWLMSTWQIFSSRQLQLRSLQRRRLLRPRRRPLRSRSPNRSLRVRPACIPKPSRKTLVRLEVREGKLLAVIGPGFQLVPMTKDKFQVAGAPIAVTFEGLANGHPQRMLVLEEGNTEPDVFDYTAAMAAASASELSQYEGTYYSSELDTVYVIVLKDDKLMLRRKKVSRREDVADNSR